jgi:hypothetical protein
MLYLAEHSLTSTPPSATLMVRPERAARRGNVSFVVVEPDCRSTSCSRPSVCIRRNHPLGTRRLLPLLRRSFRFHLPPLSRVLNHFFLFFPSFLAHPFVAPLPVILLRSRLTPLRQTSTLREHARALTRRHPLPFSGYLTKRKCPHRLHRAAGSHERFLMRFLLSLLSPDDGQVDGKDCFAYSVRGRKKKGEKTT